MVEIIKEEKPGNEKDGCAGAHPSFFERSVLCGNYGW
jgi:hypothetical protein